MNPYDIFIQSYSDPVAAEVHSSSVQFMDNLLEESLNVNIPHI